MWNALRADFQEFVTTVTEDTSNVLSQIDTGLASGDTSFEDNDVDGKGTNDDGGDNEESAAEGNSNMRSVNQAELREIMKLLRDHPGTYTEDLALEEDEKEAVDEYLKEFSIDAKTDEIAQVLEEHQDTVKKQFEELCPTQVSYEEFWKRYFFRCDEERISKQLQEESDRARQARAEAIAGGIKSVTNFFGGAVQAVASTIAPEHDPTTAADTAAATTNPEGINLFGAKGRPPFVMNTAVDESGDDDEQDDDDDEELGWDDDDDDDDLDFEQADAVEEEDTKTEQIEFTDKVSEDLQEKLKQAILERDQIQQTVQMQANEIKLLQNKLSGNPDLDTAGEVDELKLKLFEKDAELAALKARVNDDNDAVEDDGTNQVSNLVKQLGQLPSDQLAQVRTEVFGVVANEEPGSNNSDDATKISTLEKQVQELSKNLETKDAALVAANDKLAITTAELEASQTKLSNDQANAAKTSNAAIQNLEAKLNAIQGSLETSQAENAQLKQNSQTAEQASVSQISALKEELAEAQRQAASLSTELQQTAQKLKQSEDALQTKTMELENATRTPTPDTVSTGVKISTPPMQATKLDLDGSEGDDWGDDWD